MFKFVDFFAGVGGFHLALSRLGGQCVSVCEIDKKAMETYRLNFYEHNKELFDSGYFFEDITKLSGNEIPDHDIFCAGFPCQAFSIAGYRKGFEDDRGNLFFDVARIIEKKKPSVVFLENVKNLVSHDNGNTFKVIKETLVELGYYVHFKVLNSHQYGNVPQNRERIYIVGFRDKNAFNRFHFPSKIGLEVSFRDLLNEDAEEKYYYNNSHLYEKLVEGMKRYDTVYQWRRQYVRENKMGLCPTLTANMGTGGHNVPLIMDKKGIRKMTPRETFRMQGYPSNFKLPKLADSHLYKQAGNSVSVPVLERIGVSILEAINPTIKISPTKLLHSLKLAEFSLVR
ncbi:MAG TPA: DNA cytosine methyltransferase [Candidatus Absconditabacterales bacterium]|nr:DNA cytosine methyltransferase [Candidatus Absconditabacterales bacterium]